MSIFDAINPFKKKDDLGLPPLEGQTGISTPNLAQEPNLDIGHQPLPATLPDSGVHSFTAAQEPQSAPLDDHRMRMPLGENIRQARVSAMYEQESDMHPIKGHNPLQKELELISSKLDYLKASLDAVNQRLVNLEHLTRQETEKKKW